MQKIESVTGVGVPLLLDDIDTDRIIPARYLRCVSFEGLGEYAFEDDRIQDPDHPFNNRQYAEGRVLLAGRNFGCGSSREHAPQALLRWGIQAVVAESFAEIFFGNCTSLGIPAVQLERAELEQIEQQLKAEPGTEITVDLAAKVVLCGDLTAGLKMPESARTALLSGEWDFLGILLDAGDQITRQAETLPYWSQFQDSTAG